jgi:hypothetical protein
LSDGVVMAVSESGREPMDNASLAQVFEEHLATARGQRGQPFQDQRVPHRRAGHILRIPKNCVTWLRGVKTSGVFGHRRGDRKQDGGTAHHGRLAVL